MADLNDRLKAFEQQINHSSELAFRIEARTSKLFGLWAGEKLGLSGDDVKTYAGEVVSANLEEKGYDDIIRKVKADFDAKGITVSTHMMQETLIKCEENAKVQIMEDTNAA